MHYTPLKIFKKLFHLCLFTSFSTSFPILGTEFSGGSFEGFVDISQGLRRWVNPVNTSQNTPVDING